MDYEREQEMTPDSIVDVDQLENRYYATTLKTNHKRKGKYNPSLSDHFFSNMLGELTKDQLVQFVKELVEDEELLTFPKDKNLQGKTDLLKHKLQSKLMSESKFKKEEEFEIQGLDWNSKFQKSIQKVKSLNNKSSQQNRFEAYESLESTFSDFVYSAITYGKIIVSEVYLPPHQKTIKPCVIFQKSR